MTHFIIDLVLCFILYFVVLTVHSLVFSDWRLWILPFIVAAIHLNAYIEGRNYVPTP